MRQITHRALLGAAALALEAYTNPSPAGASFLGLFLLWGLLATRPITAGTRWASAPSARPAAATTTAASALAALALWSAAAALSCVLLLLQLLLPLLASAGAVGPGAAPQSLLWRVLGLRDLQQCGLGELLLVLGPPLLAIFAAFAEAQDAYIAHCSGSGGGNSSNSSSSGGARRVRSQGGIVDAGNASAGGGGGGSGGRITGATGSSPGIVSGGGRRHGSSPASAAPAAAGVLIVLAALLWPAVFNLPWLLLASGAVAAWALRRGVPTAAHAPLLRMWQLYCGLCLAVLYGWQLQPADVWPPYISRPAHALGLYRIQPSAVPLYDSVPQLLHLAALTALYGALGFAAAAAATKEFWRRRRREQRRHVTHESAPSEGARRREASPADAPPREHTAAAAAAAAAPQVPPPPSLQPGPSSSQPAPEPFASQGPGGGTEALAEPRHGQQHPQHHPHGVHIRKSHHEHHEAHEQSRHQESWHHHHSRHPGGDTAALTAARAAERAAAATAGLCRHPAVAAVALACLSMVEVSVVGGVLLVLGMWTLLAPSRYGRQMLRRCSPMLTFLLLTWNTAVYVITCLSSSYPHLLPPVLHSLGLFMYESPPPVVLPLAGQALAIIAMAGLARSRSSSGSSDDEGGSSISTHPNRYGGMVSAGAAAAADVGVSGVHLSGGDSGSMGPWRLTMLLALYHMLHVFVPISCILLGSYRLDLLHGVYMLWVLLYCGGTALRLSPDPRVARVLPDISEYEKDVADDVSGGGASATDGLDRSMAAAAASPPLPPPLPAAPPAHRRLRLYASLHLLALYAAMCDQLPGLGLLQREQWRDVLQLVGLWDPARTRDCLPLLGALVLATVHAVAGKVLTAAAAAPTAVVNAVPSPPSAVTSAAAAPPRVMGWLIVLGSWLGSVVSSVGGLLVALLSYGMALYDMRVGVAGLGYLALGLPLLLAPPLRGQYLARLRLSHHSSRRQPSQSQPHLYLSSSSCSTCFAANARWLGPAALALYGATDLCMSYAAAMLAVYGNPEGDGGGGDSNANPGWQGGLWPPPQPPLAAADGGTAPGWWYTWQHLVILLYGGPPELPGGRLVLALARPSVVLLVLQLYRWAFAAAVVSRWRQRSSGGEDLTAASSLAAPLTSTPTLSAAPLPAGTTTATLPTTAAATAPSGSATISTTTLAAAAVLTAAAVRQRRLLRQQSTAWLVKRCIILNIDLVTVVLLFATLMASPGALSVALLAAGVAVIIAATWRAAAAAAAAAARDGVGVRRTASGSVHEEVGMAVETPATAAAVLEEEDWTGEEDEEGQRRTRQKTSSGRVLAAQVRGTADSAGGGSSWRKSGATRIADTTAAAGFFTAAQFLLAAWLLVTYTMQLEVVAVWVRALSPPYDDTAGGGSDGGFAPWSLAVIFDWLGLPRCEVTNGTALPAPPSSLLSYTALGADASGGAIAGVARSALRRVLLWVAAAATVGVDSGGSGDRCTATPGLRRRLLLQVLTLVALALRGKARRWRSKLPAEVRAAAAPGQPCCLFWPPPHNRPDAAVLPWLGPRAPLQRAVRRAIAPVASLVNKAVSRLGRGAYDVLKAMDVPADELVPTTSDAANDGNGDDSSTPTEEEHRRRRQRRPLGAKAAAPPPLSPLPAYRRDAAGVGTGAVSVAYDGGNGGGDDDDAAAAGGGGGCAADWLLFVRLVVRGCMEAWEGAWAAWGCEVALLALLLAAFTAASLVTLLLLAAVGAGMAVGPTKQAALRRYVVLPVLGIVLMYEYAAWVGLPRLLLLPVFGEPPADTRTHGSPHLPETAAEWMRLPPALAAWLGLQGVGPLLLWTLFGALAACLMQANCELSQQQQQSALPPPTPPSTPPPTAAAATAPRGRRNGGFWRRRQRWFSFGPFTTSEDAGTNDLEAPLLSPQRSAAGAAEPQRHLGGSAGDGGGGDGKDAAAGSDSGDRGVCRTFLFSPVEAWAQSYWGVLDWARYHMVLHSADMLLIALVALVAVQRDLLRAGYLAHCLLLFRRRNELARPYGGGGGGRAGSGAGGGGGGLALFGRLVVFNYLVLLLEGVFQAPWELLLGQGWALPCAFATSSPEGGAATTPACTFPRLVGLCQLQPGRAEQQQPGGGGDDGHHHHGLLYGTTVADSTAASGGVSGSVWGPWTALLNSPVVADLLVWLLLRLYVRLLRSPLLAAVTRVEAAAQQRHVAALRRAVRDEREAAARGALAASHARAVRERRIAKLKALLLSPGEAAAGNVTDRTRVGGRGGGGAGGVRGLLLAPGGGPMVAGLAELLDADVDLAGVAAAAAASGEAPPPQAGGSGNGGSSRVTWDMAAGEGGGSGSGLSAQERAASYAEGLSLAGATPAVTRSLSGRRTRSHADLDDLDSDSSDVATAPLGSSPGGGAGGSAGAGFLQRPSAEAAGPYGRQRSGGTAADSVHRRHASAEAFGPYSYGGEAAVSGSGGRRRDDDGHDTMESASEIQPLASTTTRKAAASSAFARSDGAAAAALAAPHHRRRRNLSWPPLLVRLYGKLVAPLLAAASRRRHEDDSYVCYAAFLALFLVDMTALSAVLPLSMFMYALLLHHKPRQYWQGALLYVETLLILQYSYLVLGKCLCVTGSGGGGGGAAGAGDTGSSCIWVFGRRDFLFRIKVLGLHSDPFRALPLFLCYLATLMHSYSLDSVYAAVAAAAAAAAAGTTPSTTSASAAPAAVSGSGGRGLGQHTSAHSQPLRSPPQQHQLQQRQQPPWLSFQRLQEWLQQGLAAGWALVSHLLGVYKLVSTDHETEPHWVKLQLQLPPQLQQQQPQRGRSQPPTPTPAALGSAVGAGGDGTSPRGAAGLPPRPPPAAALPPSPAPLTSFTPPPSSVVSPAALLPPPGEAEDTEGASAAAAAAAEEAIRQPSLPPPPLPPSVLRGPRLVEALRRMLETVHEYGQEVRHARMEEERWRRQLRSFLQEEDESAEAVERRGDGGGVAHSGRGGGSGAGSGPDTADADVAVRLASYVLPQLRLQHDAVASGGAVLHMLLEVVVPATPLTSAAAVPTAGGEGGTSSGGGGPSGVSPTPARDVAAALRLAAEVLSRQRLAGLSVPFRRTPPAATGAEVEAPASAGIPLQQSYASLASMSTAADDNDSDVTAPSPPASRHGSGGGGGGDSEGAGLRRRQRPHHHRRHGSGSDASITALPPPPSPPPPPPPPPPELHITEPAGGLPPLHSVECYSQPPRDLYAATAFLDLVSFMYAMVFYQLVVSSARSLADITDADRRVPLDYLAALMLLFALMVSERAVYMLGLPAAKMALHLTSQAVVLGWCLRAYWASLAAEGFAVSGGGSSGASTGAAVAASGVRQHLRVFLLLRCLGFCLGGLQLRDGYPPLSAPGPSGGGRHSSFFYRRPDWAHNLAFNVFYSLPFLYEIRSLLDWTCVSTSLDWYCWLKLEDIHSSLFVASCRNQSRRNRRVGERVPRYSKFLQGVLALAGLLLVLWLPPLFFSSGAPTYQVPALQDVHLNISIAQLSGGPDATSVQRFPLFASGDRRFVFQWTAPQSPPPSPPPPPASPMRRGTVQPLTEEEAEERYWRSVLGAEAAAAGAGDDVGAAAASLSRKRGKARGRPAPAPHAVASPPPPLKPPQPPPSEGGGGGDSGGGGGGGGLPRALAGYRPDQAMGVCMAAESDRLWHISPPARRALQDLLVPPRRRAQEQQQRRQPEQRQGRQWQGVPGFLGYAEGDNRLHDESPPVVLEVRWSLFRSAPLASQRGGPACSATAVVALSGPSRRGLAELLSGRANRTLLTSLNQTDPASHGSPALFPLFMRLKGDACSVKLGLSGDGGGTTPPVTTASPLVQYNAVRQGRQHAVVDSPSSPLYGSTYRRRALWSWPWKTGGGGSTTAATAAAAAPTSPADVADRWGSAMVGCYASLQTSGGGGSGGGGGAAEWWSFECGALLPPAASDGGGGGGGDGGAGGGNGGGGASAGDDYDGRLWTRGGSSDGGGVTSTAGMAAVPLPAAVGGRDDDEGGDDDDDDGDDDEPLQDACGGASGGSPRLSGPPLVAVLEPVQSGLLGATLSRFGITGLYVTFVFAIGRFLRLSVSSLRLRIPTEDLPSTRRLVALCQDIYVARAEGELVLEEQLFQALINVYRSPELLFELSRKHKQA